MHYCSLLYAETNTARFAKVHNGIVAPTANIKVITWNFNWAKIFPAVTQLSSKEKQLCLLDVSNLFCLIVFYYGNSILLCRESGAKGGMWGKGPQ